MVVSHRRAGFEGMASAWEGSAFWGSRQNWGRLWFSFQILQQTLCVQAIPLSSVFSPRKSVVGFSNMTAAGSPGGLVRTQTAGSTPRVLDSDSVSLGQDLGICISNKFLLALLAWGPLLENQCLDCI